MKNFIFFDIDGTIISEDGYLPESAVRAIQAARKKGNATLINTGRTHECRPVSPGDRL